MNGKIGMRSKKHWLWILSTQGLSIGIDEQGRIRELTIGDCRWEFSGGTELAGCVAAPILALPMAADGSVAFQRRWCSPAGACRVTERFVPTATSIGWELEIEGEGEPWSTEVITRMAWGGPEVPLLRLWAPWGDVRSDTENPHPNEAAVANGTMPPGAICKDWSDPLVMRPWSDRQLSYGAAAFRYDNPRIGCCPTDNDLWCIPLVTVADPEADTGVSLILSPADELRDLTLRTTATGELSVTRMRHRFQVGRVVRWHADLVRHEADWRGGLRWMTARYPAYFEPALPQAHDLGGTGAYTCHDAAFDADKMRRMAFRTNWRASFDFPYMGMFLPPVTGTEEWTDYRKERTSIAKMESYARKMREHDFRVLSYFNVYEFGAHVTWPLPPRTTVRDQDLWRDCHEFLREKLSAAILSVSPKLKPPDPRWWARVVHGGPYFTWEDGIILDCGEPAYREFLLEQARRHISLLPTTDGICIDRLDWARLYNEQQDDGESWFDGCPARSLLWSWNQLLERLGPLMHEAGKVIFVNNHVKRLDMLRHVDGIFDEFTFAGPALNTSALLGLCKPVLGWTSDEANLRPDPDAFFQRFLHMGVFPMAPFPGNDHSLHPGEWVDQQYLDYGSLLRCLRGKRWVLSPHAIQADKAGAKANLFAVPGGYIAPITFGGEADRIRVEIRGLPKPQRCTALHPGNGDTEMSVSANWCGTILNLDVPLVRGCALVRIE
jgi:hypothetical protein